MSSPLQYFRFGGTGEVAGSITASKMTPLTRPGMRMVAFKAVVSNVGNVYVGPSGVTKPDGTTDTTTGWELAPGDETGWLPAANLDEFYRISDNAGDDLVYIYLV